MYRCLLAYFSYFVFVCPIQWSTNYIFYIARSNTRYAQTTHTFFNKITHHANMPNNTDIFDGNCQGDVLDLPSWSYVFVTILISILFLINVPFNIYTLKLIFKAIRSKNSKDSQSIDYFIATFLITDIFSALISPLWLLRRLWMYKNWTLGYGFCLTFFIVDEFSSYVTSIMVLSITIVRFIAIYHPFYARNLSVYFFKIWIFIAVLLCIPGVVLVSLGAGVRHEVGECNIQECYGDEAVNSTQFPVNCTVLNDGNYYWPDCTMVFNHTNYYLKPGTISAFISSIQVVYFYIPMGLILVLNVLSFIVIKTRRRTLQEYSNKQKLSKNISIAKKYNDQKQMLYVIWIINIIYFLGYIPYAAYWTWQTSGVKEDSKQC